MEKPLETILLRIDDSAPLSRIDQYVAKTLPHLTRSQLKERVKDVLLDGRKVKLSHPIVPGKELRLFLEPVEEPVFEAEPVPLRVLHEDSRVIVVDKPAGMVVHPGAGVWRGTLVQGLLHHVRSLRAAFPEGTLRPGIVHRLDKDTSGVLIAAKDPATLEFLARQFRKRRVKKTYLALVRGTPPQPEGVIVGKLVRDPHNRKRFRMVPPEVGKGKPMETKYRVLKRFTGASFLILEPATGRTHQLRVQLRALGCPILGDPIYGKKEVGSEGCNRLYLHAYRLELLLPTEEEPRRFYAALPEEFKRMLFKMGGNQGPKRKGKV